MTSNKTQSTIPAMLGFKATDANMECRGLQFKVGEWQEVEGALVECENGFHFCEQPSGVWAFYNAKGTRVWKVEAEEVLVTLFEPGADRKRVCRRIRLVQEVVFADGHSNTGHRNTGHRNTGDSNTGHRNTGDRNTGYSNTGHSNTGHSNTGYSNTGNSNTGDSNTGHRNTGHRNTGDRNTGDSNTGHRNTGNGNVTDFSSGFFNQSPEKVRCFDGETGLTRAEFENKFPQWFSLCECLLGDETISFNDFSLLPNITPEKLLSLHEKFKAARKENK